MPRTTWAQAAGRWPSCAHCPNASPVSVHGVGLSIGGERALDRDHLARLRHLIDWLDPASFSEHLAWSTHDTGFLNDLLPLPLYRGHADPRRGPYRTGCRPPSAVACCWKTRPPTSPSRKATWTRWAFSQSLPAARAAACFWTSNNVFVSATNQNWDPRAYIDAFPLDAVGEIHLGGHDEDEDEHGAPVLIDSHGRAVVNPVWTLYAHTIARGGPRPTLIEWGHRRARLAHAQGRGPTGRHHPRDGGGLGT